MTRSGSNRGKTANQIVGGVFLGPVIQGRDVTVVLPTPAPQAMRGLPADLPTFVGRDAEVGRLLRAWESAAGPAVTVVSGLPGVGKTALVIHAAHRARIAGLFPGGMLFADLAGFDPARRSDPALVLAQFVRALGVQPEHTPSDEAELHRLYLSLLAEQAQPILIFLDNVASSRQAASLVSGVPQHRTVVTSRRRLSDFAGARHLEVNVLDPVAAVAMLDGALRAADEQDDRIAGDPAAATELAVACGLLPLALWIAAVLLIADPERPVSELVTALAEERERLSSLSYGDDLAVRATFMLSYQSLDAEHARLFRMLGLHPGSDISIEAAAALADLPVAQTARLLGGLRQAYLLQPALRRGRYRFHDLLRVYAAERAAEEISEPDRDEAVGRLLDHYLAWTISADQHMSSQIPADRQSGPFESWAASATWLDDERPNLAPILGLAVAAGRDLLLCEFGFYLFWYLHLRRHATDGLIVHGHMLDAARRIPEPHYEIHSLINLGVSLAELGRFEEAVDSFQQGLEASSDYTEHGHDVFLLNDLGLAYRELGRLEEAVNCHERALQAGPDIRHEAILRHDLGLAFRDLGRLEEAADCQYQALALFRQVDDRHHEGEALTDLGLVLRDLHQDEAAISHQRSALDVYRRLGDRLFQAIVLSRLGSALADLRQEFDEAVVHLRQAREIFLEFNDHRREAETLGVLAAVLRQAGRETEAAEAEREATVVSRQVNG